MRIAEARVPLRRLALQRLFEPVIHTQITRNNPFDTRDF